MDRLKAKNDLLVKLGRLMGPLQDLAEHPELYDEQERSRTLARFCADYPTLLREFAEFSTSQLGHDYRIENQNFNEGVALLWNEIRACPREALVDLIASRVAKAMAAISSVPVSDEAVILEAHSPFSAYSVLKDLCEADATTDLLWIDAYFDSSVFHRFLRGVQQSVVVTLVTQAPRGQASARDNQRWLEFLDVSRLYSREHDAHHYRLLVSNQGLHDRWLRFDNRRLFSLGGSAKNAGDRQYFTIAPLALTPENAARVQAHVDNSEEWCGPSTPQHR